MKNLSLLLAALAMTGCVTKQQATELQYNQFAAGYVKLKQCNASGEMPTATAAYGLTLMQSQLSQYNYDQGYMQSKVNYYSQPGNLDNVPLTCSDMALKITQRQQEIAAQNYNNQQVNQALQNFSNNTPKTTFCNRYGTMVTCNTY